MVTLNHPRPEAAGEAAHSGNRYAVCVHGYGAAKVLTRLGTLSENRYAAVEFGDRAAAAELAEAILAMLKKAGIFAEFPALTVEVAKV